MHRNRSGLVVAFVLALVAACGGSGDTSGDEPSATPATPATSATSATSDASDAVGDDGGSSVSSVVIGSAGGTVDVSAGSELAPGARLVVPPAAVEGDLTVRLEARAASSDVFEPDASTITALLDYSFTSDAAAAIHPTIGPIGIVAGATPVGPEFVVSPDGAEFGVPVSLEIPVSAVPVPDGATLLALLESGDDQVEVIEDIDIGDTAVVVPLSHFSAVKIISIPLNVLDVFVFGTDEAAFDDALDLVGPHVERVSGDVLVSLCNQRTTVTFDPAGLPSYLGLLNNLARAEGDYIGGTDFDQLYEMRLWMDRIGDEGLPPVSVAEIYDQALVVSGGDAFGALVLAHETLRDDRFTKKYTQYVTDVRGDDTDEVGARYHLLGTAVYGFWYAYQQDHPDAVWSGMAAAAGLPPIPTAEEAAAFEEAYVSGDISTDPGEFVVDLQGAQLGRQIYEAVRAAGDSSATDPCPNQPTPTTTTTTTVPPTTTTTVPSTTTTTAPPTTTTSPPACEVWTGVWGRVEHRGTLELEQTGSSVTGNYDWSGGGTFSGSLNADGALEGNYSDKGGNGKFVLTLAPGSQSFSGTYDGKTPDGSPLSGTFGGTRQGENPCD